MVKVNVTIWEEKEKINENKKTNKILLDMKKNTFSISSHVKCYILFIMYLNLVKQPHKNVDPDWLYTDPGQKKLFQIIF